MIASVTITATAIIMTANTSQLSMTATTMATTTNDKLQNYITTCCNNILNEMNIAAISHVPSYAGRSKPAWQVILSFTKIMQPLHHSIHVNLSLHNLNGNGNWEKKKLLTIRVLSQKPNGILRHHWSLWQSTSHLYNCLYIQLHCWEV